MGLANVEGWRLPIFGYEITSRFGNARSGSRPAECGAGHCGVDFPAPIGVPIYAINDGTVIKAQDNELAGANAGKHVIIEHGGVVRSYYVHLDDVNVVQGQQVAVGTQVGTCGLTGTSNTPAHLHFGLQVLNGSWKYIDPQPWCNEWAGEGESGGGGGISGLLLLGAGILVGVLLFRRLMR
jgi:murein DD-endopeptidase MepM/ murein hydrolase activator NlpD